MFSFKNTAICFLLALILGETIVYTRIITQEVSIRSPLTLSSPIQRKVLGETTEAERQLTTPITVLLLGLDARVGDKNPRCDAIHLLKYDPKKEFIRITTIPRGTLIESDTESENAYIGNMCHTKGIDTTVRLISQIAGSTPDYVVKIGFSQTLGVLRNLRIPASSALQFLRNRQYAIGDYQRSRNQALFLKDLIITYTQTVAALPSPVKYLLFHMIDTNLDFEKGSTILTYLAQSPILSDASRIQLMTKPVLPVGISEMHFPLTQKNNGEEKDEEFITYQSNLALSLKNLVSRTQKSLATGNKEGSYQLIQTPFHQKLWLQIEDEKTRNQLHFDILKLFIMTSPSPRSLTSLVLDFITEMEETGESEKVKEGKSFLSQSKNTIN